MIRRPDGTPFKLKGSIQQYDPKSSKQDLFNRYDAEMIRIGGSPVFYYEVLIQTQNVDPIYQEDRTKLFSPVPIQLYASYEPPQQQNMSGMFLVDTPDEEIILELNYQEVLNLIGHPPKIGSKIHTPHRGEDWIIIERRLDQFKYWTITRLQLQCRKFQSTTTTGEDKPSQILPDYKITPKA